MFDMLSFLGEQTRLVPLCRKLWRVRHFYGQPVCTARTQVINREWIVYEFNDPDYYISVETPDGMCEIHCLPCRFWELTHIGDHVPIKYQVGRYGTLRGWRL